MTPSVRLVFAIHNHQPVGNFDGVMDEAMRDSYAPFLDVMEDYQEIPFALHTSGSLLEWLVDAHPDYVERVRGFVARGQTEILGGPFYEPILACIPRRDRVGQIGAYKQYLESLFDTDVRGMWVPERVWEQTFAGDVTKAGMEYTVLDDYHFRSAGVEDDELHGYYVTEDEGRLFKIFVGSERLRYTIPFLEPWESIDYLRDISHRHPGSIVTFGDDGEKFGTWPGTQDHVYANGWLRRFLDALRENSEWIKVTTMAEAVDHVAPRGRCYLPDCSYREMTEWALPTAPQQRFTELTHREDDNPDWQALKRFASGGFWRNFRVKYPESNEMYSRVLEVSRRLQSIESDEIAEGNEELIEEARTELYRAQCNCPYWHGAFGGLYLPHLRNAIYKHVIAADTLLEEVQGRPDRWVQIDAGDYNLDARKEVRLASDRLVAYVAPASGGHLYEFDVRNTGLNLLATLNRRPEPYHEKVIAAGQHQDGDAHDGGEVASIHDVVRFKQPNLDKMIAYDEWPRKSLVDHFLQPGLTLDAFRQNMGSVGEFTDGAFETTIRRSEDGVEADLSRTGQLGPHSIRMSKTIRVETASSGTLRVEYRLEDLPAGMPIHFGVEFNFAGIPAGASDRYFYDGKGRQLGQVETMLDLQETERIGLVDEWLGIDTALDFTQPAALWSMPIQTVSQSEAGFELVHQNCAVIPRWQFTAPDNGVWSVGIELSVDTSAAQARQLRETTVGATT